MVQWAACCGCCVCVFGPSASNFAARPSACRVAGNAHVHFHQPKSVCKDDPWRVEQQHFLESWVGHLISCRLCGFLVTGTRDTLTARRLSPKKNRSYARPARDQTPSQVRFIVCVNCVCDQAFDQVVFRSSNSEQAAFQLWKKRMSSAQQAPLGACPGLQAQKLVKLERNHSFLSANSSEQSARDAFYVEVGCWCWALRPPTIAGPAIVCRVPFLGYISYACVF